MRMNKVSPEQKESYDNLIDELDYVIEEYITPDYIQVIGSVGGDVVTHRVYTSGLVGIK